ncbi:MAG: four helix bundle protein [Candidatus Portnoybacteria bacterium CG23_combo_of_CG06-09_8_20_14_all_37_13]|uniref:Four helix bundle protein n=1 Tax=Candidatus Portnoybacteria bacterium CG23_combo_of_CG06-09_8_20_14_all_37_13 TaxID=1974819 RepID=A0A2G9YDT0_9BACT|nr:MAG: four helix bundle protein [Candidatus Portnoybacteria bacterium CG23_combo_of_CG06-09_8_20_14_all_37_13]
MTKSQIPIIKNFDLEERTAKFGEEVIKFVKILPKNEITRPLITQLVKCATSVGANYCEADDAESGQDFRHKVGICKKEARESKHFLRMIATAIVNQKEKIRILWKEAKELNLIFNSIYRKIPKK